jgi:exodeoxyribonuclease V gamma subunit
VLALLEEPALRACFGLEDGDVPLLRRWCEELHLRWGRDGADRRARGLPDDVPLTWRDGLARLQLGFALPAAAAPADDARFAGTVPLDAVPGLGQARVLARFALFVEALLRWEERCAAPRALADWADTFAALLEDFFAETADSRAALQKVREALAELREQAARAPEAGAQPFAVLRRWLARWLTGLESRRGFLHGAVTCCAMVPLRSLPFRVIAVLGMDDGAFPRQQKPWPFDLMAAHGRPGDRSRRQDDRYLFLETLLAARDVLYLSYSGQSEIDGSVRPPSPVLAELLDQARATVAATEADFDAHFITHHALQPFSPRYFSGREKLFSFAPHFAAASRLTGLAPAAAVAAFSGPLPSPPAELLTLTPARFEQFLAHPQRFFLRERLGVQLPRASEMLPDEEPVEITDRRALRRELFRFPARGADSLRAAGLLPGGAWGEGLWREEHERMQRLHERLHELGATPRPALAVDIEVDGVRWCGPLGDVTDAGLVRVAVDGPVYASDLLRLQFAHLLLCMHAPEGVAPVSRLVRADAEDLVLPALPHARELLGDFSAALQEGLCLPLPLFRRASPAYAKKQGMGDAVRAYRDGFKPGDESDAWIALLWRGTDPLDDRFRAWADRLYGPLLDALEQL